MNIVIFGLAKSGTTALFYKLKNSLPADTICLFEPRSFEPEMLRNGGSRSFLRRKHQPNVLAKVLPFRLRDPAAAETFSQFEKQILIVRDPRDRLISRLLYGLYDSEIVTHEDKVRTIVELLQSKETNPRSISVKTLLQDFARQTEQEFSLEAWAADYICHSISKPLEFHRMRPALFLVEYEQMVDGRLEKLEEYLGMALTGETRVAVEFERVTRTRSYGGWREWFTAEDVDYFRPIMKPFLDCYYPEADWELNPSPSIPSEHSSGYVLRIVNDRRAFLKLPPLPN